MLKITAKMAKLFINIKIINSTKIINEYLNSIDLKLLNDHQQFIFIPIP